MDTKILSNTDKYERNKSGRKLKADIFRGIAKSRAGRPPLTGKRRAGRKKPGERWALHPLRFLFL